MDMLELQLQPRAPMENTGGGQLAQGHTCLVGFGLWL